MLVRMPVPVSLLWTMMLAVLLLPASVGAISKTDIVSGAKKVVGGSKICPVSILQKLKLDISLDLFEGKNKCDRAKINAIDLFMRYIFTQRFVFKDAQNNPGVYEPTCLKQDAIPNPIGGANRNLRSRFYFSYYGSGTCSYCGSDNSDWRLLEVDASIASELDSFSNVTLPSTAEEDRRLRRSKKKQKKTTAVNIVIKTDLYPEEIGYELYEYASEDFVGGKDAGSMRRRNHKYTFQHKLKPGKKYVLLVFDDYGDGICCEEGKGSVHVNLKSNKKVLTKIDGRFENETLAEFTVPKITQRPFRKTKTKLPTKLPTKMPTNFPTEMPTSSPTKMPTRPVPKKESPPPPPPQPRPAPATKSPSDPVRIAAGGTIIDVSADEGPTVTLAWEIFQEKIVPILEKYLSRIIENSSANPYYKLFSCIFESEGRLNVRFKEADEVQKC